MPDEVWVPSASRLHAGVRSRLHQQKGGRQQFQVMWGSRSWLGWAGFRNGYYGRFEDNWALANDVPFGFVGPVFLRFDGSFKDAIDSSFEISDCEVDDVTSIRGLTHYKDQIYPGGNTTPFLPDLGISIGEFYQGLDEPENNESWTRTDPDGRVRKAALSGAVTLTKVMDDAWVLAQGGAAGYSKISATVRNGAFGGVPGLQIGIWPEVIVDIPMFVGWGGLGEFTSVKPGIPFTQSDVLVDAAVVQGLGQPPIAGNVTGGYLISYSERASSNGWFEFPVEQNMMNNHPNLMGVKFKNIFGAALATYIETENGIVRTACVDMNYGGTETLIHPIYPDAKARHAYQVIWPGRKASSIGLPSERWQ